MATLSDEIASRAISSHIEVIIKTAPLLEPKLSHVVATIIPIKYQATWSQELNHLPDYLWIPGKKGGKKIQNKYDLFKY